MGTALILSQRLDEIERTRRGLEDEQGDLLRKSASLDDRLLALTGEYDSIIADLNSLGYTRVPT